MYMHLYIYQIDIICTVCIYLYIVISVTCGHSMASRLWCVCHMSRFKIRGSWWCQKGVCPLQGSDIGFSAAAFNSTLVAEQTGPPHWETILEKLGEWRYRKE